MLFFRRKLRHMPPDGAPVAFDFAGRQGRRGLGFDFRRQLPQFRNEIIGRMVANLCCRFRTKTALHGGGDFFQLPGIGGNNRDTRYAGRKTLLHVLKFVVNAGGDGDFNRDRQTALL